MSQVELLKGDIKKSGIKSGMVVMIHSSFKSLGFNGTPKQVIEAFQEVLMEEGTLLMPTLTYKTVNKDHPYFSYHETQSCVGIIPETFRILPNVYRSINPIHSVAAWGKWAQALTAYHQNDRITLGKNSPYYLMLEYDPKILMLGCGLEPNTFMHLIENLNGLPYRETKYEIEFTIQDQYDKEWKQVWELPDMSRFHQRYDRVQSILSENELKEITILDAKSYLIDANALFEKASNVLKNNPYYFVDKIK